MIKRKTIKHADHPPWWTIATEIQVKGKPVTAGAMLSIKGERGRFKFMRHVTNTRCPTEDFPNGVEWIDTVGGDYRIRQGGVIDGTMEMRAFRASRITKVWPEVKPHVA
jgi:hypothetical protein